MKDLSLVEKEEDGLAYDVEKDPDVSSNVELCLMGHFLADKVIRVGPMKERIINIWWPGKGALIREIPRVYLCSSSMTKVLNSSLWSFDNHLLIPKSIKPGNVIDQIPLFYVNFMVRVHSLLVGFTTPVIGKHLKNFIERIYLLATLLVKKDSYWRHRAKMHWLQERGINTHLFHQMAYVQRKINTIEKLQDKDD
uniref:Uncharacterized protein n=1 Tax=Glycine max TaxID=3847 RepID=A0A0R0KHH7_SOYBN